MNQLASQQLNAIHAMLASGQRNLRMERHSLILWGLASGGLMASSEHILTNEQFPDLHQRAFAWLLLLLTGLGAIGFADWHLTRKVKRERDEIWSFVHRQIIKVWWLLIGMATLFTFSAFFFGGNLIVNAVWVIALGMGLYIHGLFSDELLEWCGVLMIVMAVATIVMGLPYRDTKWVAASIFGMGLPLLAFMPDKGVQTHAWQRLLQMLGWLLAVLALPWAMHLLGQKDAHADAIALTLEQFQARQAEANNHIARQGFYSVQLPAGSEVPIDFMLSGNLFENGAQSLRFKLARPMTFMLFDGKPTGEFRLDGQGWHPVLGSATLHIPWIRVELTPEGGPVIKARMDADIRPN